MKISFRDVTVNDSDNLAHILISSNESYRGYVPDKCLEFTKEESAKNWQKFLNNGLDEGHFMFFALNETDKPVAYAWACPTVDNEDYAGELYQIAVLPDYQKQGIGSALVQEVVQRLARQDIHSMLVRVLEVNPNRLFYERLGGKYVSQYPYDWDGFKTMMFVYGWKETSVIDE